MKSHPRILFIVPYPQGISPGQRFRFEHYLDNLDRYEIAPFLADTDYPQFFNSGRIQKAWILLKGYLRRFWLLFRIHRYDSLYIYRETSPVGPPVMMWLNRFIWRKPFIYDFDDAIWLRDPGGESAVVAAIKWKRKVKKLCSWANRVTVGNEFLAAYARNYSSRVQVIPTVVNTETYHIRTAPKGDITVIGWTGSHSTLIYIEPLIPVLRKLRRQYDFEFHIIANRDPGYADEFIKFIPWKKNTEIIDLQKFHIGIMPLTNNDWSKGKCGFKAIQYLALEIPAVVSPVGVNSIIVRDGEFGYHASDPDKWTKALSSLLGDTEQRNSMGAAGRRFIEQHYSVSATREEFLGLFN